MTFIEQKKKLYIYKFRKFFGVFESLDDPVNLSVFY